MSQSKVKVIAIAAMDEAGVIGFKDKLPWHIPEDMKRFAALTTGHAVLMGRKTYDSLPAKYKPLPNRKNIVVTRNPSALSLPNDVATISSAKDFINACKSGDESLPSEKLWVIGGAMIYKETQEYWDEIYLTLVKGKHEGDVYFPNFESEYKVVSEEPNPAFCFVHLARK